MDPERIWLQPDCIHCAVERWWSGDELTDCALCDAKPVEYIRADLARLRKSRKP
jgi:hypothetical protein